MTIKTNREFLTAVSEGKLTDEVKAFAVAAIAALDEKNAKRKASPSAIKAAKERDAFRSTVFAALTAEPMTAAEVAAVIGVESVPRVTAALTAFVKSGEVVKGERKVAACKAKNIKGGKFSVYSVPETAPESGTDEDEAALSAEENAAGAEAYGGGF
jgi:hypothetical protein